MKLIHYLLAPVLASGAFLLLNCRSLVLRQYEPKFLSTGPNGKETPGTIGIPYERAVIHSGKRALIAYVVEAPKTCDVHESLLIYHGVKETISDWVKAQGFLYQHCVSSVVFDYSGHGDSSPPGTVKNVEQDSISAYEYFRSRFQDHAHQCVMGHSMGNGPLLASLTTLADQPGCVIVASAFSSLRDFGAHSGAPRIVLYSVPDVWNNVKNAAKLRSRLLVIHSEDDKVNPIAMGHKIFDAAPEPKRFAALQRFKHNDLYRSPVEGWWNPVLAFISERSVNATQ